MRRETVAEAFEAEYYRAHRDALCEGDRRPLVEVEVNPTDVAAVALEFLAALDETDTQLVPPGLMRPRLASAMAALRAATAAPVRSTEERLVHAIEQLGAEHEAPPAWQSDVWRRVAAGIIAGMFSEALLLADFDDVPDALLLATARRAVRKVARMIGGAL